MHWYYGDPASWRGFVTALLMLVLWGALAALVAFWPHGPHRRR
jgi:hypothetical protein